MAKKKKDPSMMNEDEMAKRSDCRCLNPIKEFLMDELKDNPADASDDASGMDKKEVSKLKRGSKLKSRTSADQKDSSVIEPNFKSDVNIQPEERTVDSVEPLNKPIKTWSDALEKLSIKTVDIPWNATGHDALKMLRTQFGIDYPCLMNKDFDDLCESVRTQGNDEQLNAIGDLLRDHSLRFGYLAIDPQVYKAFIVDVVETRAFQQLWKGILKRSQFFDTVQMFASYRGGKLSQEIRIPFEQIQLQSSVIKKSDNERFEDVQKIGRFLFVQTQKLNSDSGKMPQKGVHVYDLSSWPPVLMDCKLEYDCNYIEPFCCRVFDSNGCVFCFRGSRLEQLHEDDEFRPNSWFSLREKKAFPGICLEDRIPESYPSVIDGEPILCNSEEVVYLVHRKNEESDSRDKRGPCEVLLLKNKTGQECWQMMRMRNFMRFDASNLLLYKKEWVLIPSGPYDGDSSYCLRLWNPVTNECYRFPVCLLGEHRIQQYIPLESGDILFYLENGRLCRFAGNLADYLRENRYRIMLEPWSPEIITSRRFDHLNSSCRDGQRRANSSGAFYDEYVAVFENGEEVFITENRFRNV